MESQTSINSDAALPPQPPKYKPNQMSETGNTSMYYARVRTRADLSRKRESLLTGGGDCPSAPNSASISRKFDPTARKYRSKTIEIGFTVKENKKEDDLADKEVETIFSEPAISNEASASSAASIEPLLSSLVITTPPIKSPKKSLESPAPKTSSDSLKVRETETPKNRLSPFNRFKNSLVMGSTTSSSTSSRKTPDSAQSGTKSPPIFSSPRQRTESETSVRSSEKRRFFYRKSRTGPVGSQEETEKSGSIHSSASNSTSNLSPAQLKEVEIVDETPVRENFRKYDNSHAVRAKSEFSPRSAGAAGSSGAGPAGASTATSNEYVSKDNYFLAAAKRWASYDKPSYNTPFTRDHWRKSHRKFNYSRFLNYTRETFV